MENTIMYKLQDRLLQYSAALLAVEATVAALDWQVEGGEARCECQRLSSAMLFYPERFRSIVSLAVAAQQLGYARPAVREAKGIHIVGGR